MARHYVGNSKTGVHVDSPEALAQALMDPERAAEIFGNAQDAARFKSSYAKAMMADGQLAAEVAEKTQLALAGFLKNNGASGPPVNLAPAGRSARSALYNRTAPGAAVEDVFATTGELFSSVSWRSEHDQAARGRLAKASEIQASFGSEVPGDGGFLIPETMRSGILEVALETAICRPHCTIIPMSTLRVPVPMIDSTSNVSSIFGGVTFFWTEEGAAITESQASFGRVVLDAKKLSGFFLVPNELLADAPAFGAFFDAVVPQGVAWFEDIAFMNGTGVGEPQGFVNCPAAVQVAAEAGQPSATIVYENLGRMFARMLPTSLNKAVWIASIDTFPQLSTMALSVGTGGGPVWIGSGVTGGAVSAADAPPMSIFGRPLYFTEKLPTLGTTGDICFVDLSKYLIGDRQVMQLSSSEHFAFQNDKTAFRMVERLDGAPWLQSAITPHSNSASTLTAFVQLASR